jgi:antitoxin (DNA-binding transcriptional repressor) of toxin-antitoxin stability system
MWPLVATFKTMRSVGIRELKNGLSRYLRQLKPGQPLLITDRGRVVAELRAPADPKTMARQTDWYERLIALGIVRPALESGDPTEHFPTDPALKCPPGTAAQLIDEDRGD